MNLHFSTDVLKRKQIHSRYSLCGNLIPKGLFNTRTITVSTRKGY